LSSAPEAPFIFPAIFFKSIPRIKFILLEWIFKISQRDCIFITQNITLYETAQGNKIVKQVKMLLTSSLGFGNSIFLSIRPGRRRAWSRISIRFVAIKTC
jgi:hypothetical protein